jgi:uncharacterized membrane protein YfcA
MWTLLTPETLASMAMVFAAGIVRGWSGFAFALVAGAGLTFLLPPQLFVPVILLIEVVLGVKLASTERFNCSWPTINPMVIGALAGTIIGVVLLHGLPVQLCKTLLGLAVLTSALIMLKSPHLTVGPSRWIPLTAGIVSGFMNGAFAMGGPPAVLFLSARLPEPLRLRASIILYFFIIDIFALLYLTASDGTNYHTVFQALLLIPASLAGVEIGKHLYERLSPERFRPILLAGLVVVGAALTVDSAMGFIN